MIFPALFVKTCLAGAGLLMLSTLPGIAEDKPATITLAGSASAGFTPDRVMVRAGVVTFDKAAADAVGERDVTAMASDN